MINTSMQNASFDLLSLISSHLATNEIIRMSSVCKHWQNFLITKSPFWKNSLMDGLAIHILKLNRCNLDPVLFLKETDSLFLRKLATKIKVTPERSTFPELCSFYFEENGEGFNIPFFCFKSYFRSNEFYLQLNPTNQQVEFTGEKKIGHLRIPCSINATIATDCTSRDEFNKGSRSIISNHIIQSAIISKKVTLQEIWHRKIEKAHRRHWKSKSSKKYAQQIRLILSHLHFQLTWCIESQARYNLAQLAAKTLEDFIPEITLPCNSFGCISFKEDGLSAFKISVKGLVWEDQTIMTLSWTSLLNGKIEEPVNLKAFIKHAVFDKTTDLLNQKFGIKYT